ncbi:MAG: hypothetical protein R8P61_17905 [Bacteroidia bacterium]|nr:hypothetical protein [Bacteroidia bacterium]
MKKLFYLLTFLLFSSGLFSQNIEAYYGATSSMLNSNIRESSHEFVEFNRSTKSSFSIGISQIKIPIGKKKFLLNAFINYDDYEGKLSSSTELPGVINSTQTRVRKQSLSLALYPLNLHFFAKRLWISVGPEYARPIQQSLSGYHAYAYIDEGLIKSIKDNDPAYLVDDRFSLNFRMDFKLLQMEKLSLHFMSNYNKGLSKEFAGFDHDPFADFLRLGFGFVRKI